jgi:hypothetical protein
MPWWLISIAVLALASCTSMQDDNHGSGYIVVSEASWGADYDTPYPFTVDGEISCGNHPANGREVYFEPVGHTDESYIGTPLNQAASKSLKQDGMKPNVPYSIKEGADLSEAIEIGLRLCDEMYGVADK